MIGGGRHIVPEISDQSDRIGEKSSVFALFSLVAPQTKHLQCENCQRQSCKSFIGLTICAEMIGGRRPFLPEILSQNDSVGAKFDQ